MKDEHKEFGPSSWAIDNKTSIYVITFLIFVIGYFAYLNLPKENFPEISIPKIFVSTFYPGTSPQNIEIDSGFEKNYLKLIPRFLLYYSRI